MKLLICSDIHGDFDCCSKIVSVFKSGNYEKLVILGDVLYHGPRNDLPNGYQPKKVIELLNEISDHILAVRGNCDTEVDQMVLNFPVLSDYSLIYADGLRIYATHGHKFNTQTVTKMQKGDILLHGHTHIPVFEEFGNNNVYINPGSVSIPKGGYPKTYIDYCDGEFSIVDFDGNVIMKRNF